LNKEDVSSPTVSIEVVLLSRVIDIQEGRDVATVNIPGAFMQADPNEVLHMRLEGHMAEMLVKLDPQIYRKHIHMKGDKPILYVELKKALYGTMQAAFLFWKLLSKCLQDWGFVINPYDWCVANKQIDGSQCTILWHVDDLKISHENPQVVDNIIKLIENKFGKEAPLTIKRGLCHEYLGMTIDYSAKGKVKVFMSQYIQELLTGLPDDMDGEAKTPASPHLFTINLLNPEKLGEDDAAMFHHHVAKLLFLCKRARPDIQTAVAFLCTRVQSPDMDDYKKLAG
jgi:Reverse transcriptase (RNA-dependent DNA polymerase)